MSSPHNSTQPCCSMLNFDKRRWVVNIRRIFEQELDDDNEIPVSIFNVPKHLMSIAPDSYTPQLLSLGPYHCSRLELHENIDGYKLSAAKAAQKKFQSHLRFQDLVEQFMRLEPKIRGCYDRYLNFNGETLAWMMAIDASFLLEFLQISAVGKAGNLPIVSSRLRHLFEYSKCTSSYHAILRDMVMLENQIPLFLLKEALEFQFLPLEAPAEDMLFSMLMGTCKELSPFKTGSGGLARPNLSECAHLLDFLYQITVPKMKESIIEIDVLEVADQTETTHDSEEASSVDPSYITQFLKEAWKLLSKSHIGPMNFVWKVLGSAPFLLIFKLPWTMICDLLIRFATTEQQSNANFFESEDESSIGQHPLSVEEIRIPSVAQLSRSGVRFVPTNGIISTIDFDKKTRTFYLPRISLDVNTEVVLRNLVAYETSNASGGPMVLTRYTELMNGIIDSEKDARLLRERGIILNGLKNDEEVANMWNGMSKSIRLTKVPFIDKVIEDINMDYDGRLKVKAGKFMKQYMFCSWRLLTLLAAVLLLILTSLQAFCSAYNCARTLHINTKLLI